MVKILPRHDLGDVIHINLCAKPDMIPLARDMIKRRQLHIRTNVMMKWLHMFKSLGNPYYIDVEI